MRSLGNPTYILDFSWFARAWLTQAFLRKTEFYRFSLPRGPDHEPASRRRSSTQPRRPSANASEHAPKCGRASSLAHDRYSRQPSSRGARRPHGMHSLIPRSARPRRGSRRPLSCFSTNRGALRSALRPSSRQRTSRSPPGWGGWLIQHLKLLLQDLEALELLAEAATHLAQAHVPADVVAGLAMARLTALRKPDGGVRGIATGDVFRRLVARTLAKEWAQVFDNATRPYQFALQARAGTDALAASVRAALSLRPGSVLVSLDGRSAYLEVHGT